MTSVSHRIHRSCPNPPGTTAQFLLAALLIIRGVSSISASYFRFFFPLGECEEPCMTAPGKRYLTSASRCDLDYEISIGRGGIWLNLTADQYLEANVRDEIPG
jgi:hypothetical protein